MKLLHAIVLTMLVIAPAACADPSTSSKSPSADSEAATSGSETMARRLAEIARDSDPLTNPYLNTEHVERLLAQPAPQDPREATRRQYRLANQLIRAGRPAEAVTLLEQLQEVLGADRVRPLLALALLRSGEQDNCIARHTSDSCLLPIREKGVYEVRENTRRAMREYRLLLEADGNDLTSLWLLNVAAMAVGEYPAGVPERWRIPPEAFAPEHDVGRFRDVAPQTGVDAVGLAGGSITEDFDGDGDLDIVVSSAGLRDPLRYFRNDGDGGFTERTREAGLSGIVGGLNTVHADYDNDGDADVLVLRGAWLNVAPATDGGRHPNSLLRNNGDGTFEDVTEQAGLFSARPTQTAAWGDYDNDGRLDLFIGNESFGDAVHPCELFRNRGDGTFEEIASSVGLDVRGLVKGVAWGDYTNDGRPDLYVSRLRETNLLFRNDGPEEGGGWRFTEVAETAGVTRPIASFPTWFWDYDNDGWLDLFVSGYGTGGDTQAADVAAEYLGRPTRAELPRLYRNNGDGTFADVTRRSRLDRIVFTMGCNFGDIDNDGWLDMYLGTGDPDLRALVPNRMFRNAAGAVFQDVTTSANVGHLQKGHGVAFADLDNDGDQDIYAGLGGFFSGDVFQNALFENPGHGNRWITLRLEGVRTNRSALGARIEVRTVEGGQPRTIHAVVSSGGSFGGSSLQQEIGLGRAERVESVIIRWPASGTVQRFEGLSAGKGYRIREGVDEAVPLGQTSFRLAPDTSRNR